MTGSCEEAGEGVLRVEQFCTKHNMLPLSIACSLHIGQALLMWFSLEPNRKRNHGSFDQDALVKTD